MMIQGQFTSYKCYLQVLFTCVAIVFGPAMAIFTLQTDNLSS